MTLTQDYGTYRGEKVAGADLLDNIVEVAANALYDYEGPFVKIIHANAEIGEAIDGSLVATATLLVDYSATYQEPAEVISAAEYQMSTGLAGAEIQGSGVVGVCGVAGFGGAPELVVGRAWSRC